MERVKDGLWYLLWWLYIWKVKVNQPQNNKDLSQDFSHLLSKFGGFSLNGWCVIMQTSLWLTERCTHTHTDTGNNNNTRRPKQASSKNTAQAIDWPLADLMVAPSDIIGWKHQLWQYFYGLHHQNYSHNLFLWQTHVILAAHMMNPGIFPVIFPLPPSHRSGGMVAYRLTLDPPINAIDEEMTLLYTLVKIIWCS